MSLRFWKGVGEKGTAESEGRGFILVMGSRGPAVIYGALFAAVAANRLAASLADCNGDVEVFGATVQASSFVASIATVEGIMNAILGPLMGAFADLTPYRKTTLYWSLWLVAIFIGVQSAIFISEDSDKLDPSAFEVNTTAAPGEEVYLQKSIFDTDASLMVFAVALLIQIVAYEMAALLSISYASELSSNKAMMTQYIAAGYTVSHIVQLGLAIGIVALSFILGWNSFESALYCGVVTVVVSIAFFVPGVRLLGHRREVNPEFSRKACGLVHVKNLVVELFTNFKQARLLLFSWAFASAGVGSVTTLSTSYLEFHLGFDGTTVSLLLALALVFSIPGTYVGKFLVKCFTLRSIYLGALISYMVSFTIAPFLLVAETIPLDQSQEELTQFGKCDDPVLEGIVQTEQVVESYIVFITAAFTCVWGLNLGIVYVVHQALYAMIIPGARESSYFGLKVTFSKSLTWAPPALFVIINETNDLTYSLLIFVPFFFIAAFFVWMIDEEKGREEVAHTLHLRQGPGFADFQIAEKSLASVESNSDDGVLDNKKDNVDEEDLPEKKDTETL